MIKMIFSDMDGTLLTPEQKLPDGFGDMLKELKKRNCLFVPASGRQYYSLLKTFAPYKDDMIFMGDNGNVIRDGKGKEYFADVIPQETVKRVYEKSVAIDQPYITLCCKNKAYITHAWDKYLDECLKYFEEWAFIDKLDDIANVGDDVVKIAVADCEHVEAEQRVYNPFVEEFKDDVQVVLSSNLWVDVMNNGAGKGRGVKVLQEKLGIKPIECAAFGDFLNDYTMMQAVDYSFAMANAFPELKKVAKYEAPSNAEFGVVKKVYELLEKGLI